MSPAAAVRKVAAYVSLFPTGRVFDDALRDAPNPKPSSSDKAQFGRLASLYTAFSSEFATYALELCLRHGLAKVADPFCGMGTLAEAARSLPIRLEASDISPFAALSSAFRAASVDEIEASLTLLTSVSADLVVDNERAFYSQLLERISSHEAVQLPQVILTPTKPKYRAAAATVYIIALSRILLYRRFAGSNPTWLKRPNEIADGAAAFSSLSSTIDTALKVVRRLPLIHPGNRTNATWASIDERSLSPGSIDAIVTSPPYANRTDYFRHYLPAIELLLSIAGQQERPLRSKQIGTPLIRSDTPSRVFPRAVKRMLEVIKTHPSYASSRYYHKGFLYYFADMYDALETMYRWVRKEGLLVMVVQDSYYKDVYVPTSDLLTDIAKATGFRQVGRNDWLVRQSLSNLSPHSRRTLPNRDLRESAIAFSK